MLTELTKIIINDLEFKKQGYFTAIPKKTSSWYIQNDFNVVDKSKYEKDRLKFLEEYSYLIN